MVNRAQFPPMLANLYKKVSTSESPKWEEVLKEAVRLISLYITGLDPIEETYNDFNLKRINQMLGDPNIHKSLSDKVDLAKLIETRQKISSWLVTCLGIVRNLLEQTDHRKKHDMVVSIDSAVKDLRSERYSSASHTIELLLPELFCLLITHPLEVKWKEQEKIRKMEEIRRQEEEDLRLEESIVRAVEESDGIPVANLILLMENRGWEEDRIMRCLEKLKQEGKIEWRGAHIYKVGAGEEEEFPEEEVEELDIEDLELEGEEQ